VIRPLLLGLLIAVAGCGRRPSCPTVAFAAGSLHSVAATVAESLAVVDAPGPRVCYRLTTQQNYEQIDQPDAEIALAERLVADPSVAVVVGHLRSRGSLAAAPVYGRAGVPQIVPASTSRLLRVAGPWTFVLAPTDSAQSVFLAAAVDSVGARRALLFYSGEPYGEGLVGAIRSELFRRDVQIVDEVRLGMGTDVATLAEAAVRRRPVDVVVLMVDVSQAAEIARTIVPIRPGLRLLSADGADYPTGLRYYGGAAAESLWIVSLWRPDTTDPVVRRYVGTFRRLAGRDPTPTEALGADAMLYAEAAIRAVGHDRSAIRAWLAGPGGAVPPEGHVTAATLHGGAPPKFYFTRIGPPPPAPH
jgi:branched-chain amino acid transport system substrate-binding protein